MKMKSNDMRRNETKGGTVKQNVIKRTDAGRSGTKQAFLWSRDAGIDGILVTVGLCIIALLLCVVMKDSLAGFIETIVEAMTTKATDILSGVGAAPGV
ncbi:MAG: hypothetical protein NC079_09605 [Clostridium sp.]|nr:hypothetical protein [Acetatifactor muris]MCM1563848.1 hypothetical protein [Clostridium sp.]